MPQSDMPSNARFNPLDREPAYRQLAEVITGQILDGTLPPGFVLPIEQKLADQFNVHRSTLREGLRVLEQNGLVRREGKKLIVQRPPHEGLARMMGRALVLHDVTFKDVHMMGQLLYSTAAELAAVHATDDVKAKLQENLVRTRAVLNDPDDLTQVDLEFMHLIAQGSGNTALVLALEPLGLIFYAVFHAIFEVVPVAGERLLASHQKIYDSIVERNSYDARRWMNKHCDDFLRGVEASGFSPDDSVGSWDRVILRMS